MTAPARRHLYKKPDAVERAEAAYAVMQTAIGSLDAAEHHLNVCGYKGAARGIHQANERVKSWATKVAKEIYGGGREHA